MPTSPFRFFLVLSVVVAACAETTVVGVTGEPDASLPPAEPKIKRPSTIELEPDQRLGGRPPILGDVDGDGYDDFVIVTQEAEYDPNLPPVTQAHLFYGRAEFPEQLSTADAAAAFLARGAALPVGDINGDGLADFVLDHSGSVGFEIVLGNAARYQGAYTALSAGLLWQSETFPPPIADLIGTLRSVEGAGDVNCDGIDDLLVSTLSRLAEDADPRGSVYGVETLDYLVFGSASLPSGPWNANWAAARFDQPGRLDAQPGLLHAQGDIDGDGCDDLLGLNAEISSAEAGLVFYGRRDGWDTPIAHIVPERLTPFALGDAGGPLGDLDGDGVDDVALVEPPHTIGIIYGSHDRWAGIPPAPELLIELDEYSKFLGEFSFAVGDIDGDRAPDLVIGSGMYGLESGVLSGSARGAMYALRGSGERYTGTHVVSDSDLLLLGPAREGTGQLLDGEREGGPGMGAMLSVAGDIDGDGGNDILTGAPSAGNHGAVYFIPSGPPTPR